MKIGEMIRGPQPRNHNAKLVLSAQIEVLRAVTARVVTHGSRVNGELEGVVVELIRVIRGLDDKFDFGIQGAEAVTAELAAARADLNVVRLERDVAQGALLKAQLEVSRLSAEKSAPNVSGPILVEAQVEAEAAEAQPEDKPKRSYKRATKVNPT